MRKHISSMDQTEVQAIVNRVQAIAAFRAFIDHSEERKTQKNVTARDIDITLRYGLPVEIHNEAGELRALISLCFGKPKVRVCVVIALATGAVITTWKNAATDKHATLDVSLYGWQADVVGLVSAL